LIHDIVPKDSSEYEPGGPDYTMVGVKGQLISRDSRWLPQEGQTSRVQTRGKKSCDVCFREERTLEIGTI